MSDAVDTVETLARDIYPAEVLLPDGSMHTGCRVFVTTDRMSVWAETTHSKSPYKVIELQLAERNSIALSQATMMRDDRLEVVTTEGTAFVNKGLGCCKGALKALWAPAKWPIVREWMK